MRTVRNTNVANKKVLYRADYNLPVGKNGEPSDDARVLATIPTLEWLLRHKPAQIIILTHWGRPKKTDAKWRLGPRGRGSVRSIKKKQKALPRRAREESHY